MASFKRDYVTSMLHFAVFKETPPPPPPIASCCCYQSKKMFTLQSDHRKTEIMPLATRKASAFISAQVTGVIDSARKWGQGCHQEGCAEMDCLRVDSIPHLFCLGAVCVGCDVAARKARENVSMSFGEEGVADDQATTPSRQISFPTQLQGRH